MSEKSTPGYGGSREFGGGNVGIKKLSLVVTLVLIAGIVETFAAGASASVRHVSTLSRPDITQTAAFDVSPAVRDLAYAPTAAAPTASDDLEVGSDRGPVDNDGNYSGDQARQDSRGSNNDGLQTIANFEGLKNLNNVPFFGHGWTPPDPVGAVGPNHYVEMVNTVFAVYDKEGSRLSGPSLLGSLWQGFAVSDCAANGGDPVVLYDRRADRWILTQFSDPTKDITYNCVAVSKTSDPTGAYFRYAFSWGLFFPDYPKYSVWRNAYLLTSRDFGPTTEYGISVASLERQKMISGDPSARMVRFFLDSAVVPIYLMGDGLLPADIDGWGQPDQGAPAPIVGTMNIGGGYGAPFDALNVFELSVDWQDPEDASLNLATQLPVAPFTSKFPCKDTITPPPTSQTRSCIPQPGTTRKIDVLSYRQRPTFRLAYRNFGGYEAMVTNQSVQATPGMAGVRWYEIRRTNDRYTLFQQGTYAPADGVHRWMGSIAMDRKGNIGLGYSVSNATTVYPGIRFTGRLKRDPLGQMTLGEGVIIDGSGSQRSTGSRWGDYTAMNIDPTDDCTFWYVNEYIQTTGPSNWQTRIASFRLPGCAGG
jgi:hypothetical protein